MTKKTKRSIEKVLFIVILILLDNCYWMLHPVFAYWLSIEQVVRIHSSAKAITGAIAQNKNVLMR